MKKKHSGNTIPDRSSNKEDEVQENKITEYKWNYPQKLQE